MVKNDRSGPGELVYKNQVVRLGEVILDALINTLGTRQEFNYTQTVNEEGQVSFFTFYCDEDERPIGFVQYAPTVQEIVEAVSQHVRGGVCYSAFVYITDSMRGKGHLKKLYEAAYNNLKTQNIPRPLFLVSTIEVPRSAEFAEARGKMEALSASMNDTQIRVDGKTYYLLLVQ